MNTTGTTETIALNRLVQSKANVRRTGQTEGLDALMASIAAHGLRQNLNVKPTTGGRYEVVAGGRRLIALKKLARAGTIPADLPVPCIVLTEADNPTEISLAENAVRVDMHPDDQCSAFQSLVAQGLPVDDVAARYGVTPAVVRQRLKLAAVSPRLRALYRAGDTTLSHLMAVTLTDDHAAQEAAFAEGGSPSGIRHTLTRDTVRMNHRLVRFVGLDAYTGAGGGIIADLFNPEDGFLTDPDLLQRLAVAKLDEAARAVAAEGWAWVQPELTRDWETDYRRLRGERDEATGAILFSDVQKAESGARVVLNHDGEVDIDRGLVRREDEPRGSADAEARPARPDYPASVITDLTAHRTAALRLELARRPDVALAAVVHALVSESRNVYSPYSRASCLDLTTKSRDLARSMQDPASSLALEALSADFEQRLERLPGNPRDLWTWCLAQPQDTLLDVLALFAALTVDAVSGRDDSDGVPNSVHEKQLAAALDLNMTVHWMPTPAFMGRLSKDVMAKALTESGNPTLAADLAVIKKTTAADRAALALAAAHWLPPVLRAWVPANDNRALAPWDAPAAPAEADDDAAAA